MKDFYTGLAAGVYLGMVIAFCAVVFTGHSYWSGQIACMQWVKENTKW